MVSLALADPTAADAATTKWTKGPYLQGLTTSGVSIDAEVDPPGPMQLDVAVEADGGDAGLGNPSTAPAAEPAKPHPPIEIVDAQVHDFHALHVTGLLPAHRYRYTIRSGDALVTAHFVTPPADDSSVPFSFLAYGDNRTDDAAHAEVVRKLAETPGDFLVNTGDLVEDGSDQDDWETFFRIEGTILKERCLYACVGNHELIERAGTNFLTYVGPHDFGCIGKDCERPIRLYGTYRWSNARFFLLNGIDDFSTGVERDWLSAELTRADSEPGLVWRIVVVHHGPYSAGPHGDNLRLERAKIPEMFAQHHVDLVLSGHDHIYERGFENGLRYVVTGGGGAPLYRDIKPRIGTRRVEATHHITRFEVGTSEIQMTATRVDGTMLERCGFKKSDGPGSLSTDWDCDAHETSRIDGGSSVVANVNTTPPDRKRRCSCDVIGARAASIGDPWGWSWPIAALFFGIRRRRIGRRASLEERIS